MTIGLNVDMHARRKSWCACTSIIVPGVCKRYASEDNSAISAFAFVRQGSRRAALMGIGASTKANDAICECLCHPDRRRRGAVSH